MNENDDGNTGYDKLDRRSRLEVRNSTRRSTRTENQAVPSVWRTSEPASAGPTAPPAAPDGLNRPKRPAEASDTIGPSSP